MKYIGNNNEYFEMVLANSSNIEILEDSNPSELILMMFDSDDNVIEIDYVDYTFNTHDIVCLTEFHKVKTKDFKSAKLIKWNKYFYCIINHDSEVGCKGILYYGASKLPIIHPNTEEIKAIKTNWQIMEEELKSNDSLQGESLQASLKRLLVLCTRIYRNQEDFNCKDDIEEADVDIIREYHFLVEKHFKEKHCVSDYAELLNKSPKTLSNLFNKLGSKSPLQFIQDRKMLEARRLLAYSDLTVSEVGYDLGFSDIQSFSRFFKRESGASPNYYKEQLIGKIDN